MGKQLEKLSKDQVVLLAVKRDEWLGHGFSTEPADRATAEAGVAAAYREAGLEPPGLVIWLRSPLEGVRGAGAERVATDEWGTLHRLPVEGDEDVVMVEVANSTPEPDGSVKDYWLRVPPGSRSPVEALAWTFEVSVQEYREMVAAS